MNQAVVVLGSGLAGYSVAREFRRLDKETPLVVISRDHGGFYSKPMLSNALAGKKTAATLVMKTADKMAAELNAQVRVQLEVTAIDANARTLTFNDGAVQPFRDLVLALGADPIQLPLEGDAAGQVLSVNDLDDYGRFGDRLEGARTVLILGAGLIGCEFANDLLARDIQAVVIDLADRVLSRLLPEQASAVMQRRLEVAGVQFRLGTSVVRIDRSPGGVSALRVQLADGSELQADLVLSAIGLQPRTQLARAAGLATQRGIVCDRRLATSAPQVYAVGDCAEILGHTLPYVMPIMHQSRALAATLAGQATDLVYPAMPVMVKTPACPAVVCPPPVAAEGSWQVGGDDQACEARFVGADGSLYGFALLGGAVAQKQALAALVPGLIPAA